MYEEKNAYEVAYLKEFFKWIGFTYLEIPVEQQKITEVITKERDNYNFDVFVLLKGHNDSTWNRADAPGFGGEVIELDIKEHTERELLTDLINKIGSNTNLVPEERSSAYCSVFNKLREIYEDNSLVNCLFEYTSILIDHMDTENRKDTERIICTRFESALAELDSFISERKSSNETECMEYVLYAKFSSQTYVNRMAYKRGEILEYRPEEFYTASNEVYEYDKDMYKTELLKARVAEQNIAYKGIPRVFYESALQACKIPVCKSIHYYNIGKWEAKNGAPYDAMASFRQAYFYDNNNIKVIFKVAVQKKELGETETARIFLNQGIDALPEPKDAKYMSPKAMEYAYKFRLLMADIVSEYVRRDYEEDAYAYLKYIESLSADDNKDMNAFTVRMFPSGEKGKVISRKAICASMLVRLKGRKLKEMLNLKC